MLRRLLDHGEGLVKGLLFDCRRCGQCVLRRTALRCPMRCPKGLRNGPCGGGVDGRCEIEPQRPCIWVRIDRARHGEELCAPPILPALREDLRGRASLVNALTGADAGSRDPLPALGEENHVADPRPRTASRLEARMRAGRFVCTAEVRGNARGAPTRIPEVDAVNATAFVGGRACLPSVDIAAELRRRGHDAVAQLAGRDLTRTALHAELLRLHRAGIDNCLCLTGDRGDARERAVYAFDAALMVWEARHLRVHGRRTGEGTMVEPMPRPFLGVACNPQLAPATTGLRRMLQKAAAGAEFAQTQPFFSPEQFAEFHGGWCAAGLDRRLFLIAGIPVITSRKGLDLLHRIPGVRPPPTLRRELEGADDLTAAGRRLAARLIDHVAGYRAAHGVHLMCFGPVRDHLGPLVVRVRRHRPNHEEPAPWLSQV